MKALTPVSTILDFSHWTMGSTSDNKGGPHFTFIKFKGEQIKSGPSNIPPISSPGINDDLLQDEPLPSISLHSLALLLPSVAFIM